MVFITGFPGFLATEFMKRMAQKNAGTHFICLIQTQFKELAEKERAKLSGLRVELIEGDITAPELGLRSSLALDQIKAVYHFAAVYDLNVEAKLAERVNVHGTEQVIAFCARLQNLERLHYVSTCYVSGRFEGTFLESDLELGQSFNNHYESSKYEAEKRVRSAMHAGLPATIYRPSIVVGNSKTGETQKFDGPYFVIQWLRRQKKFGILPKLQTPEKFYLNVVPSDYVLDSFFYLSQKPSSLGKTFHLADPTPLTIAEMIECLGKICKKRIVLIPCPKSFLKWMLKSFPALESWLGIPRGALDYFVHPTRYDTLQTQTDLEGSGIHCPNFRNYAPELARFQEQHPSLRTKPLV